MRYVLAGDGVKITNSIERWMRGKSQINLVLRFSYSALVTDYWQTPAF